MRVKYAKDFPARPMKPPGKPCLISVAIIGLRNITMGEEIEGDPVLEVVVPSVKADPEKPQPGAKAKAKAKGKADGKGEAAKGKGKGKEGKGGKDGSKGDESKAAKGDGDGKGDGKGGEKGKKGAAEAKKTTTGMEGLQIAEGSNAIQTQSETIVWSKKPETRLHDKDTNKKWVAMGRVGYEFLNVVHIVLRPKKREISQPIFKGIFFQKFHLKQDITSNDVSYESLLFLKPLWGCFVAQDARLRTGPPFLVEDGQRLRCQALGRGPHRLGGTFALGERSCQSKATQNEQKTWKNMVCFGKQ